MTRAKLCIAAFLIALAALVAGRAAAQTWPERGRNAVVDAADMLPDKQEQALAERLIAWERATGHQLVVATVPDLEGRTIADYAVGLFRHWRLGRAGANDGVLLLLAPNDRRVRIEVGYGLEETVTDALASRIIRETILPDLDEDPAAALSAGAERIMAAAGGVPAAATPARLVSAPPAEAAPAATDDGPSVFWVLLISFTPAILIVAVLVWLLRRGRAPLPGGPVRPLSKRAQARRENRANRAANLAAQSSTWTSDPQFSYQHLSNDSSTSYESGSWSSSDSGGFDSGGGSSGGGGSDSSY